jgi:hypothetical protein
MNSIKYENSNGPITASKERTLIPMSEEWEKKLESELSLQEIDTLFANVAWAREQISSMLDAIADHKEEDHECPIYCIPDDMSAFLHKLPPDAVLLLLQVALKDAVLVEDASEDVS